MTLPVFSIAVATLRDIARFALNHPLAVAIATICVVPIEYHLALMEVSGRAMSSPPNFAVAWALSVAAQLIWLPLFLLAIREVVSGQKLRLQAGRPSAATGRYAAYNVALLLASLATFAGSLESAGAAIVRLVLAVVLCWLAIRTTLTFSALALGRLDLGLIQSIARTTGLTWRLLAIMLVPAAAMMAVIFAFMAAMSTLLDVADGDAYLYPIVFLSVACQFALFVPAIAGAHVYRRLEGDAGQNGRY